MNVAGSRGFSLVELLLSLTVTLLVSAALLAAVRPTDAIFNVQTESADMQQRLRVASRVLFNDLVLAGAGMDTGAAVRLSDFFPPVLPYRRARTGGDSPGTFRPDVASITYVPSLRAQTTTASAMAAASGSVRVNLASGCPLTDGACGFSNARVVLIHDGHGSFDLFRVDDVQGSLLSLHHSLTDSTMVYPPGSRITEVVSRSYFLRTANPADGSQLLRDDGDDRPAVPVLDHVVQMGFAYFGDPRPPVSPPAPALTEQPTSYPPGENCVSMRDGAANIIPRLPELATPSGRLVELTPAMLTDGPWCPDASAANRFDADLLRVRRVLVTVRVESANGALRGPAGALFIRGGTSPGGHRVLPDHVLQFYVAPRNVPRSLP
jgi:hypothetical protein